MALPSQLSPVNLPFDQKRVIPRKLSCGVSLPEKDVPIFLAALAARATHLITGDLRDFGRYFGKTIEGVRVITPSNYLREHGDR